MWHLAERWGRMTPAGVSVPLGLTHETIGRLVGARRPTVSLALKQLAASGTITRREDGAWLLEDDSARALAPDGPAPRRPDVALLAAADRPRPAVLPAAETFERLRVRMRLLEHAYSMYSQHTVDLLERCRQTRLAVADSRGERTANGARSLTRPR
jgi:hypothetical protein